MILPTINYIYAQTNLDCYTDNVWIFYQLEYSISCIEERLDNLENNQKTISNTSRINIVELEKEIRPTTELECYEKGYDVFYFEPDFKPYCIMPNNEFVELSSK